MSMMNKMLLKSEAMRMLAVNMETQSPIKSETLFYHLLTSIPISAIALANDQRI